MRGLAIRLRAYQVDFTTRVEESLQAGAISRRAASGRSTSSPTTSVARLLGEARNHDIRFLQTIHAMSIRAKKQSGV